LRIALQWWIWSLAWTWVQFKTWHIGFFGKPKIDLGFFVPFELFLMLKIR
jgi:hypothetical protein